MRVVDASDKAVFVQMCDALAGKINASGIVPDVILGVRNGGGYVADAVHRHFPAAKIGYVTSRRGSTGTKEKLGLKRYLRYLPVALLDLLRIVEARWLARGGNPERKVVLEISPDIAGLMKRDTTRVLVIDDAVDSGYTLKAVMTELTSVAKCRFSTAAITVTTDTPVVRPDFTLYNDNVLVRFPWSMDARHKV